MNGPWNFFKQMTQHTTKSTLWEFNIANLENAQFIG